MPDPGGTAGPGTLHQLTITLDPRDPLQARFLAEYLAAPDGTGFGRFCLLAGYLASTGSRPASAVQTLLGLDHAKPARENRPDNTTAVQTAPAGSPRPAQPRLARDATRHAGPVGARLFGLD